MEARVSVETRCPPSINRDTVTCVNDYDVVSTLECYIRENNVWSHITVHKSPGDGHCFIHSLVMSYNLQLPEMPKLEHRNVIKSLVEETTTNALLYIPFIHNKSRDSLLHGMSEYVIQKKYNTGYGDLVPVILSNSLHLCIVILMREVMA